MDVSYVEELVSVREASKESGRNMETVRRWIWSGRLPAQKLGNQLFIRRRDWEIFLKNTNKQKGDRFRFIERAAALRERIRARTGTDFDISALIEESRRGHSV
jgi:hypothetical protein